LLPARPRQGRSLWLPTLPFQQTNRYAVVGETSLRCTLTMMSCFYLELVHHIKATNSR